MPSIEEDVHGRGQLWLNLFAKFMAFPNSSTPDLPSTPSFIDISSLDGGMLAGTFLACAVWGATSFQAFLYFMKCERDSMFLKCLVGILWALDTANQILLARGNWRSLIAQYGNPAFAVAPRPEYMQHGWIAALVYCAVQLYFIRRIYIFAKSSVYGRRIHLTTLNSIFATLLLLTAWQLVAIVVFEIYGYGQSPEILLTEREIALHLSSRAAAVAIDVVVAACMVFLLTREAPHFKRSKRLVHRLLIITVSSGSLTAVLATVALILVAVDSETFYWATLDFPLCSVYLSTLLANLNTREYIKGNYDVNTTHDIEASNTPAAPGTTMLVLKRFLDRDHEKNALPVPDRVYIHVQSHTERESVGTVTPSL